MKLATEADAATSRRYQIAFDLVTRELGITHYPHTVWLTFVDEPPDVQLIGFGRVLRKKEQGAVNNKIIDGYLKMKINLHRSSCNCEDCQRENGSFDPLGTFCHEMVHVKQLISGELSRSPLGVKWRDHFYKPHQVPRYEDMPWEHEANRLGALLAVKVKAAIAATK